MSKKDYIQVATIIRSLLDEHPETRGALVLVATKMADVFRRDNAAFDRSRFLTACGLTKPSS